MRQLALSTCTLNNKNGSLVFFYKRVLGKLCDDNLVPRAINDYAIPDCGHTQIHYNSCRNRCCPMYQALPKDWIPHCKKTFNGVQSAINYLGKFTHRIAISNHLIIRVDGFMHLHALILFWSSWSLIRVNSFSTSKNITFSEFSYQPSKYD